MKLLHVGQERELADRLDAALLKAGQHVAVTWAGSPSDAMIWLQSNQDLATAIVEDHAPDNGCAGLVRDVRGLGEIGRAHV